MNATPSTSGSGERHSKQALRLWLRLLACESMLEQHIRTRLRQEFAITLPQFDVLAELDYMNKPLTMTELSKRLMVSNGNVTGVVDRLARDAYVERLPSTDDRRVQLIALSEKGADKFRHMATQHEHWIGAAFAGMELAEIEQVTCLLNQVSDTLKTRFG